MLIISNLIDLTNQIFGQLTVIARAENTKDGKATWLCKCKCGEERIVVGKLLRNGQVTSCKICAHKNINSIDLSGQRFGRLTVINKTEKRRGSSIIWICKCDCGNFCEKPSQDLRSGHCSSCGCLQKESRATPHKDLTGQTFGRLTVKKLTNQSNVEGRLWECVCECGNIKLVSTYSLTANRVQSCGCLNSVMNSKIELILKKLNIIYEKEKIFSECKDIKPLKFDFYLPNYNTCLEYDGQQHFLNVNYWGDINGLIDRQKKDNIKTKYCKEHNIKLIRINYLDKEKVDKDYILNLLKNTALQNYG